MTSTTTLTLNMQLPNYSTVAYAVQGDSLTRQIVASLVDGSTPWTPPDGALAVVRYVKPDGTVGFYDTLEGGGAAVTTAGNVATITLALQMLAVPGDVIVQLNYYTSSGEKITAFNFRVLVQPEAVTDATITSSDYFRVLTDTLAEAITAMEKLTLPVPVANGGTGATTADAARDNLGLGDVSTFDILPVANGGTGASTADAARAALGAAQISHFDTPAADVTISSSGYTPYAFTPPSGVTTIGVKVLNWTANDNLPFSAMIDGSRNNRAYVFGSPGQTITGLQFRVIYSG